MFRRHIIADNFFNMKNIFILLICSVFLSSCLDGLLSSPEEPCNFLQYKNHRVAWESLPLNLFMDDSTSDIQRESVLAAIQSIHSQYRREIFNFVPGVQPSNKWQNNWAKKGIFPKDNKSSIYWISTGWPKSQSLKQAVTRTRRRGTSLKEVDIIINSTDFDFFLNNPDSNKLDLHSLYIHELLHSVGLQHITSDPKSTMKKSLGRGAQPQRRKLANIDKESLKCEYN